MAEARNKTPVFARSEATINASIETAWGIITDIESWPSWNSDVKSAELDGELVPGTTFRWKVGMGTITSRLEHVHPPEQITWSGSIMGIKAIHTWRLSQTDSGTFAETEESWDGILPFLFRWLLRGTLQKSLDSGMFRLKQVAEERASQQSADSS